MKGVFDMSLFFIIVAIFASRCICRTSYCPKDCICESFFTRCRGILAIPRNISRNTPGLDIRYSHIQALQSGAFKHCPYLVTLQMLHCRIDRIQSGAFSGLLYLQMLYLWQNNFHSVQPGLFTGLSNLRRLNCHFSLVAEHIDESIKKLSLLKSVSFRGNQISTIQSGSFSGLRSLVYLELSSSEIQEVETNGISNLPSLMTLDLRDNSISHLSEDFLNGSSSLYELNLSGNKIVEIQSIIFSRLQSLIHLSLGSNNLTGLDGIMKNISSGLQVLSLGSNNLTGLDGIMKNISSGLQVLSVNNNNIRNITAECFRKTRRLFYINLAHNHIKKISTNAFQGLPLVELNLQSNLIEIIETGAFRDMQRYLRIFNLNDNQITNIESDAFTGSNIDSLYLSGNRIASIAPKMLNTLKANILILNHNRIKVLNPWTLTAFIKELRITDNKIELLTFDSLKGLSNLRLLHLSRNNIMKIETFRDSPNLMEIYLNENNISHIQDDLFSPLNRLRELNLADNQICSVTEKTFANVSGLQTLDLSGNKLRGISAITLNQLPYLYLLSVARNQITNATGLKKLRSKILSHVSFGRNKLTDLPQNIFVGKTMLETIDFQGNEITSFPSLPTGGYLKQLFLANNKLQDLPLMAFKDQQSLVVVLLDNNLIGHVGDLAFQGGISIVTISLSRNPIQVIEDNAFSLPSLKLVNLLDTFISVPLQIWPAQSVTFTITQRSQTEFGFEISPLRSKHERSFLDFLGYVCNKAKQACSPCKTGTFKHKDSCKPCPAGGFYQDEMAYIGAKVLGLGCKQCPYGTYVKPDMAPGKSETDCQSCPQGTFLRAFALFRACRCLKNYHRTNRFGPCLICSKGYTCANDSTDLSPGFFWVWENEQLRQNYEIFKHELDIKRESKVRVFEGVIPIAHACPNAGSCLGGSNARCSVGYSGPLCAVCDQGYYNLMSKCQKCPSLPWIIGQITLVVIVLIVLVVIIFFEKKKTQGSRSITDLILARLKIVIGFYQVSSTTFDSFTYIRLPSAIVTMMKYAKVVQLNLLQIVPISCISGTIAIDTYGHFSATIVSTVSVILVGATGIVTLRLLEDETPVKSVRNQRETHSVRYKKYQENVFRCAFLILFISFPSTCTQVFQMLPSACHKICSYDEKNCNSYLRADYAVKCNTSRHNTFSAISSVALFYCTGFPLVLFIVLKRFHGYRTTSAQDSIFFSGIRFLYENYSPRCYFWEITELVRKIAFSAILILMNAESRLSLGITAILSELYSVFFALNKPIEDGFEHWLQLASLIASSVNFTMGMLLKVPKNENSSGVGEETDGMMVAVLLITANVTVILIVAVKYISSTVMALIEAKNNRECSALCCLEMAQLIGGAHGDVMGMYSQDQIGQSVFRTIDEQPTLGGVSSNIQELAEIKAVEEDDNATDVQEE